MLLGDVIAAFIFAGLAIFFILPGTRAFYDSVYSSAPVLVSFLKFAFLATGGEWIARRIKTHSYSLKGFGLLPKAIVWGILGVFIYWSFQIFGSGVPKAFPFILSPQNFGIKLLGAFLTSLMMNLIFSPVLMLTHHVTDNYISLNNGGFPLKGFKLQPSLEAIDWKRMWGFVFKKTIPFFWIPAHTITFLLPSQYRTLFAALLSVALGILLGIAGRKKNEVKL
jgi:hypothetical protein